MKFVAVLCLAATSICSSAQSHDRYLPRLYSVDGAVSGRLVPGTSVGTGSNPSSTYVRPYISSEGALVPGHHRTMPDTTTLNNYGTLGNFNPYTGAAGTRGACARPGC